jgi:GNAT superfamily N-acetyltransferase
MIPELVYRQEVRPGDDEIIRGLVVSTGFFYDCEVPVAMELVQDKIEYGEDCDYHFLFAEINGKVVAYTCYGPIAGTEGSYDLYWIVTDNDYRGKGIGRMILEKTHSLVKDMGARIIIAETSALEKYAPTRHFYLQMGYIAEGKIDDFYKKGDGKVIFIKRF